MPDNAKSAQRQRLAEALRANLKRRKAAARTGGTEMKPVATDDAHDGGSVEIGDTKRD